MELRAVAKHFLENPQVCVWISDTRIVEALKRVVKDSHAFWPTFEIIYVINTVISEEESKKDSDEDIPFLQTMKDMIIRAG